MKRRRILPIIILLIVLAAWLTKPGADDFNEYLLQVPGIEAPPVIEETNGYVYSLFTVTFVEIRQAQDKETGKNTSVAVTKSKEKYLGLFGHFWKL